MNKGSEKTALCMCTWVELENGTAESQRVCHKADLFVNGVLLVGVYPNILRIK